MSVVVKVNKITRPDLVIRGVDLLAKFLIFLLVGQLGRFLVYLTTHTYILA